MNSVEWCDKQGSRDRQAWAVVVAADGALTPFRGASLPGLLAVSGQQYRKDGKWSNTTFRLALADGVRFVHGRGGWETGLMDEGVRAAVTAEKPIDSWADIAHALGATQVSVEAWIRARSPRSAAALDERAAALATLGVPA